MSEDNFDAYLEEIGFKNFEEFRQALLNTDKIQDFDDSTLSDNDLKSKAKLAELNNLNLSAKKYNVSPEVLLRALPNMFEHEDDISISHRNIFWSKMAGELDDEDAENLILNMEKSYRLSDKSGPLNLYLNFALKNDVAWDAYSERLLSSSFSPIVLINALRDIPKVQEKHLPLLHQVFGKEFTDFYLDHKNLIDRTPRKQVFTNELRDINIARFVFLRAYKDKIFDTTEQDTYEDVFQSMQSDDFRQKSEQIFDSLLLEKDKYLNFARTNRNESWRYDAIDEEDRQDFPDVVKKIEEAFPLDISDKKAWELSNKGFQQNRIAKQIDADEQLKEIKKQNPWLINDILLETPDNIEQVKSVVDLFYAHNKKPKTYFSEYNNLYPASLMPIAKINMPSWMRDVVASAVEARVVSLDSLGSVKNLYDACKTWKINPHIWKKEAQMIGKMPLEARMVAGAIFSDMQANNPKNLSKNDLRDMFWQEMKKAQEMGWKQAVLHYCHDNFSTRGRVLSLTCPNIDKKLFFNLVQAVSFKEMYSINEEQLNKNFEKFEKYFKCSKDQILVDDKYEVTDYVLSALRMATNLHKLFPSEELLEKYARAALADENNEYRLSDALRWVPSGLSDEQYADFAHFLEKNLFSADGAGNEKYIPIVHLEEIAKLWPDLNAKQRQFSYDKLLGLTYTQQTNKTVETEFKNYKLEFGDINVPKDIRLYQKFLMMVVRPATQEQFDNLLKLDRSEVLQKIGQTLDANDNQIKRCLVDFVVGNNAKVDDFMRSQLAMFPPSVILEFRAKNNDDILSDLVKSYSKNPQAKQLWQKYYIDITGTQTNSKNEKVLALRKDYQSNMNWLVPASFKMGACFGNDYLRYLKKVDKFNQVVKEINETKTENEEPLKTMNIHDAVYWLPNNVLRKDSAKFMELIDKHLFYRDNERSVKYRPLAEFEGVAKVWSVLSPEERKLKYKDILSIVSSKKYLDAKYPSFASEAARWGIDECVYKNYEKIYEQGLQVPELIDSSQQFSSDNLTGRFLPRDDPRIGFFGKWTDCCQHYEGVGRTCAVSSVRDPFSQLFVVENSDGRIVAGSWVWESKIKQDGEYYKAFCFDNIEAIGDYQYSPKIIDVYKKTLPYLAKQNYAKITVGVGNQDATLKDFQQEKNPVHLNSCYSGYTDAITQKLMLNNPNASPVDYNHGDIYVVGALNEDITAMKRISNICFPEGDRMLQLPESDPQGLLLKDKDVVVGYVVWSEKEHSIYDMAVLPEYRKDKNASSLKLLNEMVKKVKSIGGEWSAELRDNTSLRYMKAMSARGLVDLKVGDIDHVMSDGTKVYQVSFTPKDRPQNRTNSQIHMAEGRGR